MTVTLRLLPEVERQLRERAQEQGMDVATYVEELVIEGIGHTPSPRHGRTFAEILAPVHGHTRGQGVTDEEIGDFVDAEMRAYRAERRANARQA